MPYNKKRICGNLAFRQFAYFIFLDEKVLDQLQDYFKERKGMIKRLNNDQHSKLKYLRLPCSMG